MRESAVRIAVLLPELLGTYGDGGNAAILEKRLAWRGIAVERLDCTGGQPFPDSADLYLLGGGEDRPQTLAARELRASGVLARAAARGATILGVCAGFQLLGHEFPGADGPEPGLDVLDVTTTIGKGPRAVGELLVAPDPSLDLPLVSGFENHQGVTALGPGVEPLGEVIAGSGNGVVHNGIKVDGGRADHVIATYAHGPVLARNPAFADLVLELVVGSLPALDAAAVEAATAALRRERLAAVRSTTAR